MDRSGMDLPRPVDFEDERGRIRPRVTVERLVVLGLLLVGGLFLGLAAEFWPKGGFNAIAGFLPVRQQNDVDELRGEIVRAAREGDVAQALLLADRLVKVDPKAGYFERGRLHYVLKDYPKAIEDFSQLIKEDPKSVEAHGLRAAARIKLKDYDAALQDAEQLVQLEPREGHMLKAEIFEEQKDIDKALTEYDEVIKADPAFKAAYFRRYQLLVEKEDYDKALADVDRLIEIAPSDGQVLRGDVLAKQGKSVEAIEAYSEAIKADRKNATAYNNRAYHRALARKDLKDAVVDIEKALTLREEEPAFIDTRGYLFYLQGNFKGALADFNDAIEFAEQRGMGDEFAAEIYYHRGLVHRKLGENELAEQDFDTAKKLGFEWKELPEPLPAGEL